MVRSSNEIVNRYDVRIRRNHVVESPLKALRLSYSLLLFFAKISTHLLPLESAEQGFAVALVSRVLFFLLSSTLMHHSCSLSSSGFAVSFVLIIFLSKNLVTNSKLTLSMELYLWETFWAGGRKPPYLIVTGLAFRGVGARFLLSCMAVWYLSSTKYVAIVVALSLIYRKRPIHWHEWASLSYPYHKRRS